MSWKRLIRFGCFIIFLAHFSISPYLSAQSTKMDEDVRIIHNEGKGKWADNPRLSLKLIMTIGGLNVTDENQIFGAPDEVALDNEGCLYVMDQGDRRIQKFGPDGHYLATIGRQGQGPGEFQLLSSFDIDAQGLIYVNDLLKCKILNPKGRELKSFSLPRSALNGDIHILTSGEIAIGGRITSPWTKEKAANLKLIQIFNGEGKLQKEFGEIHDFGTYLLNSNGNRFHFDVDDKGNYIVSFIYQNRIEKYSPEGKLLWKADRVLDYSTKPLSEGTMEADEKGRSIQAPNMNLVSFGIATDGKGRSWVITVTGSLNNINMEDYGNIKRYKLEVFNSDGILLQEIPLQLAGYSIHIHNNQLLLLDHSRSKVFQFTIVEKENV